MQTDKIGDCGERSDTEKLSLERYLHLLDMVVNWTEEKIKATGYAGNLSARVANQD